jgi:hypothetical protein
MRPNASAFTGPIRRVVMHKTRPRRLAARPRRLPAKLSGLHDIWGIHRSWQDIDKLSKSVPRHTD